MKRIDRIYVFVSRKSHELTPTAIQSGGGVTAKEVATALQLQRSNASKDLNQLVAEGLLVKSEGRPVRFLERSVVQGGAGSQVASVKEPLHSSQAAPTPTKQGQGDIFKQVIGSQGSMKVSIEQAKAAILYPPKGLNCLITGATGSGKTHFAHIMFEFAKSKQLVAGHEELVVFNCADYAHNAELLMSHLFGYAAGAFTGAHQAKEGLIEQADGGMLFLDEIHRLPPEGQEMIFYFMDHGRYNRLGETAKERTAEVRIICATTEETSSYLLNTFVRRIPISIQLPTFNKRQTSEKIELVKAMMGMEAERIQRKILVTEEVVKALIGSVTYGNIGQLKSNIQLICARSFLGQMEQEEITITLDDLTEEVKGGLSQLANDRHFSAELAQGLVPVLEISPNRNLLPNLADAYELPYNLYEMIDEKATLLKKDGVDQESINQFILTDINVQLRSFYQNHRLTFDIENKLAEIVEQTVIDLTKEIFEIASAKLGADFQVNFIYALSLHISSFLKRSSGAETTELSSNPNIRKLVKEYPAEYEVALEIKRLVSDAYHVSIPLEEVEYLTVLLVSLRKEKASGRIGIVVAAHGNSTASSMVQVVKQLFGSENLAAVDMPLEMKPRVALEEIVTAVEQVNRGSGVMLLVDMGSLATFGEELHRRTGVPIRTLDMVTTALVLEVARKTELLDTDLDDLFESLKHFRGYGQLVASHEADLPEQLPQTSPRRALPKGIVAICASGQGTAQRMKEIIETYLVAEDDLVVLPISVVDMASSLAKLQEEYQLLATTGIVDPKIEVPYIPMELLFSGEAKQILEELILDAAEADFEPLTLNEEEAKEICLRYLTDNFTFLNPAKVLVPFWAFTTALTAEFLPRDNQAFSINMVMHLGGLVERVLSRDYLTMAAEDERVYETREFQALLPFVEELAEGLGLSIPKVETYYLLQILNNTLASL